MMQMGAIRLVLKDVNYYFSSMKIGLKPYLEI